MVSATTNQSIFDLSKQLQTSSTKALQDSIRLLVVSAKGKNLKTTKKDLAKAFAPLRGMVQRTINSVWDIGWEKGGLDVGRIKTIKTNKANKANFSLAEFAKDTEAKTPDSVKETITQKREKEKQRSQEYKISWFRQRSFGRDYVNKRTEYLSDEVSKYYLEELEDVLPSYFESMSRKNRQDADLYETLFPLLSPSKIRGDESKAVLRLKQFNNAVNGQKTARKLERLVTTELTAAYNLGRLEEFIRRGVKFVRWNNDAENKAGFAPGTNILARVRNYQNSTRYFGFPYSPSLHRVCPICQERARRETPYGIGVYAIEDILSPTATLSAPPLHPYCECYLEPVDKKTEQKILRTISAAEVAKLGVETDETKASKKRTSKWVIGAAVGGAAILSMALMYKLFKNSLGAATTSKALVAKNAINAVTETGEVASGFVAEQVSRKTTSKIRRLLPKQVTQQASESTKVAAQQKQKPSLKAAIKKQRQIKQQQLLAQLQESALSNNLPSKVSRENNNFTPVKLPELKVSQKIERTAETADALQELDKALAKENYKDSSVPIAKKIDDEIDDAAKTIAKFNLINPSTSLPTPSSISWEDTASQIRARISTYDRVRVKADGLTAKRRKEILNQYTRDLNLLNQQLIGIENGTVEMYAKYQKLSRLRDEARAAMQRAMDAEEIVLGGLANQSDAVIDSTNKIIQLEDQLHIIRKAIDRNIELQLPGGYKDELIELQKQLRANPFIQEEYLKKQAPRIEKAFNKIPNDDSVTNVVNKANKLNDLVDEALAGDLTYENYRRLVNASEKLEDELTSLSKQVRLPSLEVDVDFVAVLRPEYAQADLVLKAQTIKDTKDALKQSQDIINRVNYVLDQRKEQLAQMFMEQRGGITKAAQLQKLQNQRRYLVSTGRLEEAETIAEDIERILRAEFKLPDYDELNYNKRIITFNRY